METLDLLKSGQLAGSKELKISVGLSEFPMEIFDLADSLELLVLSNNCLSRLPNAFGQLKKLKVVFFNNNQFETFPAVLTECPELSMISFKGNRIREVGLGILSPAIRWLILTDNRLSALPADIGKLSKLQKLMLAGNQLQALPKEMAACQSLELIRLSANRLTEVPGWLFSLPRLSWLAYAGNPCCDGRNSVAQTLASEKPLPTIDKDELPLGDTLGQGASGVIYKSLWMKAGSGANPEPQEVAVKLFKGEVTSDGLPEDEMQACIAAGDHPNLVTVLARLGSSEQAGLVFSSISPNYKNLGGPPSLDTCTRDTYDAEASFTLPVVLRILSGIAAAITHLHSRGIMHGDLYAHNITGESILGDFGAASLYDPADVSFGEALQQMESRAFGCLIEDLLDRCSTTEGGTYERLRQLQHSCMQPIPVERPLFLAICETLHQADE